MTNYEWSVKVKERDNFTCLICEDPGIHAHHIQPVAYAPEKRRIMSNGVTLCRTCHRLAHRNWTGATGGHKYNLFRSFAALQARSKGNKSHIAAAVVIGDALNSAKAYKLAGQLEKHDREQAGILQFCDMLNCQPGDILKYEPDAG